MAMTHLIEVDDATGDIVSEWKNDTALMPAPVAPVGRTFVDVTDRNEGLGHLSAIGYRYVGAALVPPAPNPKVTEFELWLLFTPSERGAIRAARAASPDAALEDFYGLMEAAGRSGVQIPLSHPLVSAGTARLVTLGLLTSERRAEVLAGTAPS